LNQVILLSGYGSLYLITNTQKKVVYVCIEKSPAYINENFTYKNGLVFSTFVYNNATNRQLYK